MSSQQPWGQRWGARFALGPGAAHALTISALTMVVTHALAAPSVYPTGVTRYDPGKAYNGYVLFSGQDKKTHLIDMNGHEVHQWQQEGSPPVLLDPALTEGRRGHVLLQLPPDKALDGRALPPSGSPGVGELDWDGRVVWQWRGAGTQQVYGGLDLSTPSTSGTAQPLKQHHDWRRLPNGHTLLLVNLVRPAPAGFKAEKILDDGVIEVSPAGEVLWRWTATDHLGELGFSEASLKLIRQSGNRNDRSGPFDYLHFNSMAVVGPNRWFDDGDQRFHPDNVLVGSREANLLAIIDKRSGRVVWRLGPDHAPANLAPAKLPKPVDQILGQHDAHIIPKGLPGAGHLLVFDNQGEAGYPRVGPGTQPRSRVLEIDPIRQTIVWQYTGVDTGRPGWSFYSSFISSARRLPNGNTLIDEGMNGRFFQVTANGEIVWEYISPYFGETRGGGGGQTVISNSVYRAQPVPYDWVPEGTPRSERAVQAPELQVYRVPAP